MNEGIRERRRPGARGRPSRDKAEWFVSEELGDDTLEHDGVYDVSGQKVILNRRRKMASKESFVNLLWRHASRRRNAKFFAEPIFRRPPRAIRLP